MQYYNKLNNLLLGVLSGVLGIVLFISSSIVLASEANIALQKAPIDPNDNASLQRGAKYFMNFCGGCHSAEYIRYSRVAKDIKITDSSDAGGEILTDILKTNLMFNTKDIHSHIKTSMNKKDAQQWFGVAPPDLTMVSRVRGQDWVYTYLKSFYRDPNRPWGVNNTVFKEAAMPNVLESLQGIQELQNGKLVITKPGRYTEQEFDQTVTDITNFLTYTAEPYKPDRKYYGIWVLLFLSIVLVFASLTKKEYWKDIKRKK